VTSKLINDLVAEVPLVSEVGVLIVDDEFELGSAANWRDLAVHLYSTQVLDLETTEHLGVSGSELLERAREYASANLAHKVYFATLDRPAGVVTMANAGRDSATGRWCRGFRGTRIDVMTEIDLKVEIVGDQYSDGSVVRYVEIDYLEQGEHGDIGCFTLGLADAQRFSKALVSTLQEIEHLGTDQDWI